MLRQTFLQEFPLFADPHNTSDLADAHLLRFGTHTIVFVLALMVPAKSGMVPAGAHRDHLGGIALYLCFAVLCKDPQAFLLLRLWLLSHFLS